MGEKAPKKKRAIYIVENADQMRACPQGYPEKADIAVKSVNKVLEKRPVTQSGSVRTFVIRVS